MFFKSLSPSWLCNLLDSRSAQTPSIPDLFPDTDVFTTVGSWSRYMFTLPIARQCTITRIQHCKSRDAAQHEFLMFDCLHPDGFSTTILTERVVAQDVMDSSCCMGTKFSCSYLLPMYTPSSSTVDSLSDPCDLLQDHVTIPGRKGNIKSLLGRRSRRPHILAEILFADNPPTLAEFVFLLGVVSMHHRKYTSDVFKAPCSWFVRVIRDASMELFGGVPVPVKSTSRHTDWNQVDMWSYVDGIIAEYRLQCCLAVDEAKRADEALAQHIHEVVFKGYTEGLAEVLLEKAALKAEIVREYAEEIAVLKAEIARGYAHEEAALKAKIARADSALEGELFTTP